MLVLRSDGPKVLAILFGLAPPVLNFAIRKLFAHQVFAAWLSGAGPPSGRESTRG